MPARLRPLMTKFSFYENKNPLQGAGFLFPNTQTVILKGAVFLQKSHLSAKEPSSWKRAVILNLIQDLAVSSCAHPQTPSTVIPGLTWDLLLIVLSKWRGLPITTFGNDVTKTRHAAKEFRIKFVMTTYL